MTLRPAASPPLFARWGPRGTAIVLALAAVGLLLIGGTVGLLLAGSASDSQPATMTRPAADSVDVGFLRDMTLHHEQGVQMAHIVLGNDPADAVRDIAADIQYQQTAQVGQMGGFLLIWEYPRNSLTAAPMAWMPHDAMGGMMVDPAGAANGAVMPGMATNAEMAKLQTLRGADADVFFLQLMIWHHQGGTPMMTYAAANAVNPVVRNMAKTMADAQGREVSIMTAMLADTYKQSPLPPPGGAGMSGTTVTGGTTGPGSGGTTSAPTSPSAMTHMHT
jgi:uncharacterized protein (DUF305 family)